MSGSDRSAARKRPNHNTLASGHERLRVKPRRRSLRAAIMKAERLQRKRTGRVGLFLIECTLSSSFL
eukprot:1051966-Rhodomonas_salina.5